MPPHEVNVSFVCVVKDSASFLRIGSLNVKVRRTTEAFNALLSRDSNATDSVRHLHKNYGSSDSLPEEREPGSNSSSKLMPPPIFGPMKKRKIKKERSDNNLTSSTSLAPSRPMSSPLLSSLSSSLASLSSSSHASSSTTSKTRDWGPNSSAVASYNPASQHPIANDSDSDNACGFGSDWQ
ncbi:hypothetical protein FHG87_014104 [Trinorchestia longiramus]|nr:hypothetical protein FHG87_014104 [Trinorchestia longiramus]